VNWRKKISGLPNREHEKKNNDDHLCLFIACSYILINFKIIFIIASTVKWNIHDYLIYITILYFVTVDVYAYVSAVFLCAVYCKISELYLYSVQFTVCTGGQNLALQLLLANEVLTNFDWQMLTNRQIFYLLWSDKLVVPVQPFFVKFYILLKTSFTCCR
jgi:hypothetical protein